MHSLSWESLAEKMQCLTGPGGNMVCQVSLAVEINNKHACHFGMEVTKETDGALEMLFNVTAPVKLVPVDQGDDDNDYGEGWRVRSTIGSPRWLGWCRVSPRM